MSTSLVHPGLNDHSYDAVIDRLADKNLKSLDSVAFEFGQLVGTDSLSEKIARANLNLGLVKHGYYGHFPTSDIHVRIEAGLSAGTCWVGNAQREKQRVRFTPFVWKDPKTLPRRECLYGNHYFRKFMVETIGMGGGGKSLHAVVEALAMASGRNLLGYHIEKRLRVWYINLEDPLEETERRVAAAALHYNIDPAILEENLGIDSGRDQSFVVMKQEGRDLKIVEPTVNSTIEQIVENDIDVVIIDPFVSSHEVEENDNSKIQQVAAQFVRIAQEGNCAVELIHHVTKASSSGISDITADSGRGGGALKDKARSVRVLNGMSMDQAKAAGINIDDRFDFFRVDFGKANLVRRTGRSQWRRMVSVSLGNNGKLWEPADYVGVVTEWDWPSAESTVESVTEAQLDAIKKIICEGEYREDSQAKNWAGNTVAAILDLELTDQSAKRRVKKMLDAWIAAGHFKTEIRKDSRRKDRKYIVVCEPDM